MNTSPTNVHNTLGWITGGGSDIFDPAFDFLNPKSGGTIPLPSMKPSYTPQPTNGAGLTAAPGGVNALPMNGTPAPQRQYAPNPFQNPAAQSANPLAGTVGGLTRGGSATQMQAGGGAPAMSQVQAMPQAPQAAPPSAPSMQQQQMMSSMLRSRGPGNSNR